MKPYKKTIYDFILENIPNREKASHGRELIGSCPICGTPKKKLYIGPFDDSEKPITYNCYICKASGLVDENFLSICKVSANLDYEVWKENSKGSGMKQHNTSKDFVYQLNPYFVTQNELTDLKLKYINDRLGTQLTYKDCADNRIVLNIMDLLNGNNINYYSRPQQAMEQLNNYFIGFMTRSCSMVNMRNLVFGKETNKNFHPSMQSKYVNYKIFNNSPEDDFYLLPCTIDVSKHVKVFIAEGPMDVLGIKYNLIKSTDNCLYIAGKGKAYRAGLLWAIMQLASSDVEFHLFPDKDVSNGDIRKIFEEFSYLRYRYFIHNNKHSDEKDYGVPEWRISDYMWEEKTNFDII